MSPVWRNLPSLSSLRAFDAVARHGGFTGAGRVLNVTHAAVTQQVRGLEQELGVSLVRRAGRSVALTEAGERLAQVLNEAFGGIASGIDALCRSEARRPLRVATTTFIAEVRIMPRLPEFWARCPGVEVAMTPSHDIVDFARDGFDLAVRALSEGWTPSGAEDVRPLARTPVLAVCAPSLLAAGASDPQHLPWILEDEYGWDFDRLRDAGVAPETLARVKLGSRHLEMSAARRGLGCMLATEIICRDDLAAGRLVSLPLVGLPILTYAAVLPKGPRRPAVEEFVAWLATIFEGSP
ncbi:LysR substrate-binding domain-containing protein [Tabrizicola sp. BL-A-41-H6]|uniref:LysR substrate-binding domain-containing protein n=1 Tax=Tabrizicola sp. BL-A-41-H6 TaxID=3421107 RepID=UPI003D664E51